LTTREDALPCSYAQRAEPTRGIWDTRETSPGEDVLLPFSADGGAVDIEEGTVDREGGDLES